MLEKFAPAFNYIKSLCREIQSILFSFIKDEELNLKTLADSSKLYNSFMKVLKNVIADLNADQILT